MGKGQTVGDDMHGRSTALVNQNVSWNHASSKELESAVSPDSDRWNPNSSEVLNSSHYSLRPVTLD